MLYVGNAVLRYFVMVYDMLIAILTFVTVLCITFYTCVGMSVKLGD